jgi:hypothetical protein
MLGLFAGLLTLGGAFCEWSGVSLPLEDQKFSPPLLRIPLFSFSLQPSGSLTNYVDHEFRADSNVQAQEGGRFIANVVAILEGKRLYRAISAVANCDTVM